MPSLAWKYTDSRNVVYTINNNNNNKKTKTLSQNKRLQQKEFFFLLKENNLGDKILDMSVRKFLDWV